MSALRLKPSLDKQEAEALASAHLLNEPITVTLSSGQAVEIWSLPLKRMFLIAHQREVFRATLAQHQAFLKFIEQGGEEKVWEKGKRLAFWGRQWVRELDRLCRMILTASAARRQGSRWARWREGRRIGKLLRRATWGDCLRIVEQHRRLHDIERIAEALFGPPDPKEEKKTPGPPGGASSPPPSGSGGSISPR